MIFLHNCWEYKKKKFDKIHFCVDYPWSSFYIRMILKKNVKERKQVVRVMPHSLMLYRGQKNSMDLFCVWARDPGVQCHGPMQCRLVMDASQFPSVCKNTHRTKNHLRPVNRVLFVEWEAVSPFDPRFPQIMEFKTKRLGNIRERLDEFCIINRPRGVTHALCTHLKPSQEYEDILPNYMNPFDMSFGKGAPLPLRPVTRLGKHPVALRPHIILPPVYEGNMMSVSPFDERFPSLVQVIVEPSRTGTQKKRRYRLNHQEKKRRLLRRKLREYGRESVIRKRREKKAFKSIPLGLRFPSLNYDAPAPGHTMANRLIKLPKSVPHVHIDMPELEPFPALTPLAAQRLMNQFMSPPSPVASPKYNSNRFALDHMLRPAW